MTTKRDVLIQICETPGWQPPQPVPASIDRHVEELIREGWIIPRLDGFEATHEALDIYPHFIEDEGEVRGNKPPEATEDDGPFEVVSLDRVTTFIIALMNELPLPTIYRCATLTRAQLGRTDALDEIARSIAEGLD